MAQLTSSFIVEADVGRFTFIRWKTNDELLIRILTIGHYPIQRRTRDTLRIIAICTPIQRTLYTKLLRVWLNLVELLVSPHICATIRDGYKIYSCLGGEFGIKVFT